jgi:hypothetical protein
MYCSQCGEKASGSFCSSCGARLSPPDTGPVSPRDWEEEGRYQVLLHFPEVRALLAQHAAQSRKGISGEQFLEFCDMAFVPLVGVSLSTVASLVVPIYSRLGIRTGKSRREVLPAPIGKTLVGALCSLARHGRPLKQVHQGEDGCVLEAVLPSDLWSWEGELVVAVQRDRAGTQVEAATKIPGQLFDWGKSKKCLNQLFEDLAALSSTA